MLNFIGEEKPSSPVPCSYWAKSPLVHWALVDKPCSKPSLSLQTSIPSSWRGRTHLEPWGWLCRGTVGRRRDTAGAAAPRSCCCWGSPGPAPAQWGGGMWGCPCPPAVELPPQRCPCRVARSLPIPPRSSAEKPPPELTRPGSCAPAGTQVTRPRSNWKAARPTRGSDSQCQLCCNTTCLSPDGKKKATQPLFCVFIYIFIYIYIKCTNRYALFS